MSPNEYQRLAERTECNQSEAAFRLSGANLTPGEPDSLIPVRLNHSVIGLTGEVGELASAVEKWVYYGQPLDPTNVAEEIGDCIWYLALACNALGVSMQEIMEANIRKLRVRYPEKYEDVLAEEKNRRRQEEVAAVRNSVGD